MGERREWTQENYHLRSVTENTGDGKTFWRGGGS